MSVCWRVVKALVVGWSQGSRVLGRRLLSRLLNVGEGVCCLRLDDLLRLRLGLLQRRGRRGRSLWADGGVPGADLAQHGSSLHVGTCVGKLVGPWGLVVPEDRRVESHGC